MSEFSDRPFVAGNVTGLRAFRIDTLGRLTGVTYHDVWTPGENQAQCHKEPDYDAMRTAILGQFYPNTTRMFSRGGIITSPNYYSTSAMPSTDKPTSHKKAADLVEDTHTLAGVDCTCGFYAYFDGGNDYLSTPSSGGYSYGGGIFVTTGTEDKAPRVGAIVNGWGVVTVGSRGFRAGKAEVVALISPKSEQAKYEVAFEKVRRNYPGLQVFASEVEAVRAFPLTDPQPFTPETDDDFWTRSAS